MKNFILRIIALIIAFTLVSCNTTYGENFIRNTYPQAGFSFFPATPTSNPFNSASEVTDSTVLKLYDSSFAAVTEFFNLTVEQPPIKQYVNEDSGVGANYNALDDTVYLNSACFSSNVEPFLIHELVHYVADNKNSGISYEVEVQGKLAMMGLKLNEGITEYFSQQIKPFDHLANKLDIYYFESYIAKALSTIVGEEKLQEIYINNSTKEMRELFNTHLDESFGIHQDDIDLDAFDFFCMQVDACFYDYDDHSKGLRMNSIVEELLIIGKGEGKEKEVKQVIEEFGKNYSLYLPSSYKY